VLEKLSDQPLLAKVAVQAQNGFASWTAVNKLTDLALLAKVAKEAKAPTVRSAASDRINELDGKKDKAADGAGPR
jgi:hypothetical protein